MSEDFRISCNCNQFISLNIIVITTLRDSPNNIDHDGQPKKQHNYPSHIGGTIDMHPGLR
jgi:hypothetical protein